MKWRKDISDVQKRGVKNFCIYSVTSVNHAGLPKTLRLIAYNLKGISTTGMIRRNECVFIGVNTVLETFKYSAINATAKKEQKRKRN